MLTLLILIQHEEQHFAILVAFIYFNIHIHKKFVKVEMKDTFILVQNIFEIQA